MARKREEDRATTPAQLSELKTKLLAKQDEIVDNVISMENEISGQTRTDLSGLPYNTADLVSDNYELENTLGLMDSERELLREISDALDRIDDGTYGICEGKGERIPKARLEAIPWARYCVKCAELAEMGLLGGEDFYDELDDEGFDREVD